MNQPSIWKSDWDLARAALTDWWAGKGLALWVTAPKDEPWEDIPAPEPAPDRETFWFNTEHRVQREMHRLANTFFGGVAAPMMNIDIGPGSLGFYLGAKVNLDEDTVWSEPVIDDPDTFPEIRFDPANPYWKKHLAIYDAALEHAEGRYLVGFPDLIENIDTLAQLRGSQQVIWDLVERPEWVQARIGEIDRAFLEVQNLLAPRLMDQWGGTAFSCFDIWGKGFTFKVQCDFCCMISPLMFRKFIKPSLESQASRMDNVLFHLDGSEALPQLDNILALEGVNGIEWTPTYGEPWGGNPCWYDLYRRIKDAGKIVQAVFVEPEEVEPLIEAVGPEGMFIMTKTESESEARALLSRTGWKGET